MYLDSSDKQKKQLPQSAYCIRFSLDDQLFGINIDRVQEIVAVENVADVEDAPKHVLGKFNLRGYLINILDIRACLGLGARDALASCKILLVEMADHLMGLPVDDVDDLVRLDKCECKLIDLDSLVPQDNYKELVGF